MKRDVKVLQDFPEVDLVGRKLGPFNEGEEVSLRVWEASILEERGIVTPSEEFSVTSLRKLLIKEEKSSQLEDLPECFYHIASNEIRKSSREGKIEKAEEMKDIIDSLLSLRIKKLANMTISSVKPQNIPPEEEFLVNRLSQILESWKDRFDYLHKKNPDEEVGAHKGRIGRSFQRVVRNPADIQE